MYWSSERLSSQTGGWGEGLFTPFLFSLSLSLSLSLSYLISLSPSLPLLLFLSPSFPSFNSLLLSSPLPPLPSLSFAVSPLLAPSLFLFPTISFLSLPLLLFLSPSLTLSHCLSPLSSFPLSPPHPLSLFPLSPPHPLSLFPLFLFPTIPHLSLLHPTSTYVCVHYKPVQQHGDPNQLAFETQVLIPQPFMGTIIGTAGSKIKELRSVSHCVEVCTLLPYFSSMFSNIF